MLWGDKREKISGIRKYSKGNLFQLNK